MITLPLLKQTLEAILSGQARDSDVSICNNLDNKFGSYSGSRMVVYFASRWPDRDRAAAIYPVGGYEEWSHNLAEGTLWENPKRLALVEHCIKECDVFDKAAFTQFFNSRYGYIPEGLQELLS
jgi:hypothetical protein